MIKAVIFDLDGTLIQSEQIIMDGYAYAMQMHLPNIEITRDDITNFLGQTLENSFKQYTKDTDIIFELTKTYRTYTSEKSNEELITYPNAHNIVKYLKDKNIKLGIVTSKGLEVATENLKTVGLDGMFDCLIGYESVENHKPSPDGLLKALEILNVKPEEAIYIGDHENDIKAAKKAQMLSCGVTYSHRLEELLFESPTYVVDDLINLEDII